MLKRAISRGPGPLSFRGAQDEKGFVLVSILTIMVMLVMLGLASTTSTVMELHIAGNDRVYKENFYLAEGAAMESAQRLANERDTDELRPELTEKKWLQADIDYTSAANWKTQSGSPENYQASVIDNSDNDVRIAVNALGVVKGKTSLEMTKPSVKAFELYGLSEKAGNRVIIEIGYKKRF